MTAFTLNKPFDNPETTIAELDLNTGPHNFTYDTTRQILRVRNGEAGNVTVNLLGDGVTSINCPGVGTQVLSAGYDFVIPAGDSETLNLTTRGAYLGANGKNVTVTITGATGLSFASLEQY